MLSDTPHITKYLYSTIFKTYTNDLDGIFNKIGFSKRSFAEWGSQVAKSFTEAESKINKVTSALKTMISVQNENNDNWKRNSVGEIITKDNLDSYIPELKKENASALLKSIQDEALAVSSNKRNWESYFNTLKEQGHGAIVDLIKNTEDLSKLTGDDLVKANQQARQSALAHNEALKQQTLGAKAATFATKAFSTALNIAASIAISWAISKVVEAWTSIFMMKAMVYGMSCRGIIIFLALLYQPKKKTNLSVCGGSDTNTTYRNINGRFIFRCSQAAN